MRRLALLAGLLLSMVLVGCGSGSGASSVAPTSAAGGAQSSASLPAPSAAGTSTAIEPGAPASGTPLPDGAGALPKLKLERAFGGLAFDHMTGMFTAPDGRGRVFVVEQPGRIMVFDGTAAAPQASVYLDLTDRIDASGAEMGLLGLAFAADFKNSGAFYVNYTTSIGGQRRTVISRFIETPGERTASARSSETILLQYNQPFDNHKGGQLAFGPDGMLYIAVGDGGSGNDPMGNGQNKKVLLGKILRIDVSGTSGDLKYRIPADNPFANQSDGSRGEIWSYGMRNPWRFSFDSLTGALWAGDVGQSAREEVDIIEKGGDYGWNIMEGKDCRGGTSNCNRAGLTLPIYDYATTSPNCAITGGFVYRGQKITSLRGAYVFSDYCGGRINGLRYDGKTATAGELVASGFMVSSFGLDSDGEIYVLQYADRGGIFRLTQ